MEQIFSGLNTYESTQIGMGESKYPLNCWNNQGKLKKQDYKIDFNIEDIRSYQRDYNSVDYTTDTSDSVSRHSLRYTQDHLTLFGNKIVMDSGIIKPTVSVYTDTTKEIDNGYLNAVQKLSKITFPGDKSFIGDNLSGSLNVEGINCEIYQGVEIAVSYSGSYGESGLTWFRLPSYTLHGFIFVDNIYEPFMMANNSDINPNYKYVNVYIKYGNVENLSLLHRIDLDCQETLDAYESPIEIDYDRNTFDDNAPKNFNFYTLFERRRTLYKGDQEDFGEMSDEYCDENNFISKKGTTLAIYTGLFQYEDPDKINYSWFVTNRVINESPSVELETQTFLSADDYSNLTDKYDNILGEFARNQDTINSAKNSTPWMTDSGTVDGWNTGVFKDTVFQSETKYNSGGPSSFEQKNEECESSSTGQNRDTIADVCWYTKFKSNETNATSKSFDMKGSQGFSHGNFWNTINTRNDDGSISLFTKRWGTTGTLIFQFYVEIDNEFNLIETQNVKLSAKGSVINTYLIPDFLGKYYKNNENWKVAIWYSPILEASKAEEAIDKNWYKIAEQNALDLILQFRDDQEVGDDKSDLTHSTFLTYPQQYNVTHRNQSDSNPYITGNDVTYRGFWPMKDGYDDSKYYDLAITLDVGCLYKNREVIYVDIENQEDGFIGDNFEDDLEDILLNTDGLFNKDWKVLEEGIKIENTDKLNWDYDVRHLENYDGRLWITAQNKNEDGLNFIDLYYSQQSNPEMILPLNFKGYESHITGIYEFIEQLYVFEETQVNIVKKTLTRELNGIVEPSYQFHKSFDKGAIEWTIKEHEKKLFFTNVKGQYYVEASGNYRKVSGAIDRLFKENYINNDTVDFAEMKDDFYIIRMKVKIPGEAFFDIDFSRQPNSINIRNFDVEYIAFDCDTGQYWLGNNVFDNQYVYMTKDFDGRGKYDGFAGVNQLKRVSVDYDNGFFYMYQIKNRHFPTSVFPFPEQNGYRRPVRHTLNGQRNNYFGFILIGHNDVEIIDLKLQENGK